MTGPNDETTDAEKTPEQSDSDSGKPAPLSVLWKSCIVTKSWATRVSYKFRDLRNATEYDIVNIRDCVHEYWDSIEDELILEMPTASEIDAEI